MHKTLAVTFFGVFGQHAGKFGPLAGLPEFDDAVIHFFQKRRPGLKQVVFGHTVLGKAMGQGAGGEYGDFAAVALFDGLSQRGAEPGAVVQIVHLTHGRDRHHLEVPVVVHIAHGHQGAVLQGQAGVFVSAGVYAGLGGCCGNEPAQLRVALVGVRQVFDKVGQLVAGVHPLKARGVVDVVAGIDQPVRVEHDNGIDIQLAAASGYFFMPFDGRVATALVRPVQF